MTDLTQTERLCAEPAIDSDILRALTWCSLGRVRPIENDAFHRAKRLGLLAQDPIWRTTSRGRGVLIAAGLLKGAPEPRQVTCAVLWANSDDYPAPQFVCAWSEYHDENYREDLKAKHARAWVEYVAQGEDGDGTWQFFVTIEQIPQPDRPTA